MERETKKSNKDYYALFWQARKKEHYRECLRILQEGVEQGDGIAMWLLGRCYEYGLFVKADVSLAYEWHEKSGIPESMGEISMKLLDTYVEEERHRLRDIARKALESDCFYAAGICHTNGFGTARNEKLGLEYFLRAATEQGSIESLYEIGQTHFFNNRREEALEWYMRGAFEGDAFCQYRVGIMTLQNDDREEARQWFRKSAKQGCVGAVDNLIGMMSDEKNITGSWYWARHRERKGGFEYSIGVPAVYKQFDRCWAACQTLICIRQFRVDTPLHVFPKDVVVYIAKLLWETREEENTW
jgi:TPR repeat protein